MTSEPLLHPDDGACGVFQRTLERVGARWTGIVLYAGVGGARRFSEYRRAVPGISDRLLTQRLKELEREGFIRREVIPSTPVQVLYHPTEAGTDLINALAPLAEWGRKHDSQLAGER